MMRALMLVTLVYQIVCLQDLSFSEFMNSTPSTFGLITVTHARNGVYTYFRKHLESYAEMECPEITEISVVWNNDVTPESVGFTPKENWKRPVYFVKTPYNSMDFRYTLPSESSAKVFFSIDDDMIINCSSLRKSFAIWRSNAIGDIGPLISYGPRGFNFNSKTDQFIYKDPLRARFYSISLIGICWVSRFFFELYNSQKIWQINSIRELVKQRNNCDDIALNFLVSYLFPELIPISLDGNGTITIQVHPSSQALTANHFPYRSECLKRFSEIIGYNPLRIVNKADSGNVNRFTSLTNKYAIYIKRKQITQKFLAAGQTGQEFIDEIVDMEDQIKEEIASKQPGLHGRPPIANQQAKREEEVSRLKSELGQAKLQLAKLLDETARAQQSLRQKQNEAGQSNQSDPVADRLKQRQRKRQVLLRFRNYIDALLQIISVVAVIVCLLAVRLLRSGHSKPENSQHPSLGEQKQDEQIVDQIAGEQLSA